MPAFFLGTKAVEYGRTPRKTEHSIKRCTVWAGPY